MVTYKTHVRDDLKLGKRETLSERQKSFPAIQKATTMSLYYPRMRLFSKDDNRDLTEQATHPQGRQTTTRGP